MMTDLVNLKF